MIKIIADYSTIDYVDAGVGTVSIVATLVLAAMIVKHFLKLDDRGTIQMIQENLYLQFFCLYLKNSIIVSKIGLNLKSIENLSKFYLCKQDELKIKSAAPNYK